MQAKIIHALTLVASCFSLFSCGKNDNPLYVDSLFFVCISEGDTIDLEQINGIPEACTSILIEDQFDNNSNNWFEGSDSERTYDVQSGVYKLESKNNTNWYVANSFSELNNLADYQIEVSIQFIEGNSSSPYSLTWGGMDGLDNLWRFGIDPAGFFSIRKRVNNNPFEDVVAATAAPVISATGKNRLVIRYFEGTHYFFINGNHVQTIENINLFGSEIGFNVGAFSTIEVDDFRILSLRTE